MKKSHLPFLIKLGDERMFELSKSGEVIEEDNDGKIEFLRGEKSKNNRIFFKRENIIDDRKAQKVPVFKNVIMISHVLDEYSTHSRMAHLSPKALGLPEDQWIDYQHEKPAPYDDETYAQQWHEFKNNEAMRKKGTLLSNWTYLQDKPEIIATLNASNIYLLEQLSGLPQSLKAAIPNCDELLKKAKWQIQIEKDEQLLEKFESDVKKKDKQIASLEALVKDLRKPDAVKPSRAASSAAS